MKNVTYSCLERCSAISEIIRSRRPFFTKRHLAECFEVSPRTIARDIDFLRDRLRFDLTFDPVTNRWSGNAPARRIL